MSDTGTLRRTSLYKLHKELGGRFVPFHGWELPVQFTSILQEHRAVRQAAGIFDVSHMGQFTVEGPQAVDFMQHVNSNDASKLKPGRAMYSHMLNERGGVVDDLVFSRLGADRFFLVVNAATLEKDFAWLRTQSKGFDVKLEDKSQYYGMVAVQGPNAAHVLGRMAPEAPKLKRFGVLECRLFRQDILITRTGYTGEDGFEIAVSEAILPRIWQTLAAQGASYGLKACGLGARDTLRLEAGFLLYGTDIDDEHTPFEAGCGWVVKLGKEGFIGKAALEAQKAAGLKRKLYGIRLLERGVPRPGMPVLLEGKAAGKLTSATYSPSLETGIGLAYLDDPALEAGRPVEIELHGRKARAEIAKVPFIK